MFQSLVKRTAQSGLDCSGSGPAQSPFSMDTTHPSLLRRRLSSPCIEEKAMEVIKSTEQNKSKETLCEQIEVRLHHTLCCTLYTGFKNRV